MKEQAKPLTRNQIKSISHIEKKISDNIKDGDVSGALKYLSRNYIRLTAKVGRIEDRVTRHNVAFQRLDKHGANLLLDDLEGKIRVMHVTFQALVLKQQVFSEVTRIYPEIWQKVVIALDYPDEWWHMGVDFSIKEWRARLTKIDEKEHLRYQKHIKNITLDRLSDHIDEMARCALHSK